VTSPFGQRFGISRRELIACAIVGAWGLSRVGAKTPPSINAAAALGAVYLRDHPQERRAVLTLLSAERAYEARAEQRAKSLRDFREGRVVRVDGWVLSRAEARFCAAIWLGLG
jgi:hypothetical protein